MKEPVFDKDGYPTEETLQFIENYQDAYNMEQLIKFIINAWHWLDYVKWEPPLLELHTGGWSGNEMIISALEKSNSLFWSFYWQKSERGGHYYFNVRLKK